MMDRERLALLQQVYIQTMNTFIIIKYATAPLYPSIVLPNSLQLGLGLSLLEDGLHLGCLHHVALDLELARHE